MGVFEFIIALVVITTIGKVLMAVGAPFVDKLGDIARELARSRQQGAAPSAPSPEAIEELEQRMARIEDRLDFLEELKAPSKPRALGSAHGLDRGEGPRGAMEPGTEPGPGSSPTDEPTARDR